MTTAKRSIGRIEVCAELVADTPLRIGSARSTSDIDLTVMRDGRGRVLVPGDSLAGAMRAWASTAFRNEGTERENRLVNQLFGQAVGGGSERLANAGLVTVSDAVRQPHRAAGVRVRRLANAGLVTVSDAAVDATVETRTGVGIDRATGAAAPEVFYAFEVIPRGTRLPLHIEVELPWEETNRSKVRAALGSLLQALGNGEISVGGMRARGLGEVHLDLEKLNIREFLYTDAMTTRKALAGGSKLELSMLGVAAVEPRRRLIAVVEWIPGGAVFSKDAHDGLGVDTLPLMSEVGNGKLAAVLPGSSLKGVLRARAEWFCRTLAGTDVQPALTGSEFLAQISGITPVDLLFGIANRDQQDKEAVGRRGALNILDCYAKMNIDQATWREIVEAVDDQAVAHSVDKMAQGYFDPAMHVAIDRFTGGAAESLLYSVLEVRTPKWQPLVLTLDLDQLSLGTTQAQQHEAIGLFHVLLKMLRHDMVRLGFGTMRGAGRIKVEKVEINQTPDADGYECDRTTALKALTALFSNEAT